MDVRQPATVLISELDAAILGVLMKTTKPLSGRQVSRLAEGPQRSASRALERLTLHGLVLREDSGTAALYSLNREHVAFGLVKVLMDLRGSFIRRIVAEVSNWELAPLHVSLFGSMARRDGDTTSDIDVLVVRDRQLRVDNPQWQKQMSSLRQHGLAWSGNPTNVVEIAEVMVPKFVRQHPELVENMLRDSLAIFGLPADALLRRSG